MFKVYLTLANIDQVCILIILAHMMDSVCQMTYQELYFLKKVLKETGQEILAKSVIVRLRDGSELEYGDV